MAAFMVDLQPADQPQQYELDGLLFYHNQVFFLLSFLGQEK
jgi:hypothetical protein